MTEGPARSLGPAKFWTIVFLEFLGVRACPSHAVGARRPLRINYRRAGAPAHRGAGPGQRLEGQPSYIFLGPTPTIVSEELPVKT
jgi:hypothetical protein